MGIHSEHHKENIKIEEVSNPSSVSFLEIQNSWRSFILKDFVSKLSKITLVADPDCLLTEEKLALELHRRGFDLIEFNDSIEFRYAYESKYRSIWDKGEHCDLVVILRLQDKELDFLPYDLLEAGRKLSFNLAELFPNLSYSVIEKLDRSLLDALFDAQNNYPQGRIGDNATKDYILRHVFKIAPELIADEIELLRNLLRLHFGNLLLPQLLAERLIQILKKNKAFHNWPLTEIISDDKAFFEFLQERWPIFLSRYSKTESTSEIPSGYDLKYSGPTQLPFDHQDIKVYIDNLFLEGKLKAVTIENIDITDETWLLCGVYNADKDDNEKRIAKMCELFEEDLPATNSRYTDWISCALKWAELSSLIYNSNSMKYQKKHKIIADDLNKKFSLWLKEHYASLINLPPTKPAMLHHIPRRLARDLEDQKKSMVGKSASGIALIVVDGLSLDQWVTIRQILQKQANNIILRESAIFAWIPSLTSVSRQTIFAGKAPLYFPETIGTTNNENKLWSQFWEGQGLSRSDIAYQRSLGDMPKASNSFFCYVLKDSDNSYHVDQTDNMELSMKKIKDGKYPSAFPAELIHHEIFDSKEKALERKKELQSEYGQQWLKGEEEANKLNANWLATLQKKSSLVNLLDPAITLGTTKMLGLVVDKVDKIMHGMQLGSAGMHNQIKQWCNEGFLISLITLLLDHDYEVWLTADHGNIECKGIGRPLEGVIAETKGERARVYPSSELRAKFSAKFPSAHNWEPVGLPTAYYPLICSANEAFVNKGTTIVGHGGMAIEEVIVPLVKFERGTSAK